MARRSTIRHPGHVSVVGRLRRALHWDARLPRPLLMLLVLDLVLLLPIPFLLPRLRGAATAPAPSEGNQARWWPPLTAQLPQITAQPSAAKPAVARSTRDPAPPLPLLIDPVRLQDAANTDTNTIATLLAHRSPVLATQMINVGGLEQSLASVLTGQALRWNLNPQVLLVLLETQTGLLSAPTPPTTTLEFAMRGPESARGLGKQINWAALQLHIGLSQPISTSVTLVDGAAYPVPAKIDQANYALLRLLARTHTRAELEAVLGDGPRSWIALAQELMGNPRKAPVVAVLDAPFLQQPFAGPLRPTSRFDHQYPLVQSDGVMLGNDATLSLGYDGHNAWDYELTQTATIQAAASGRVLYAGWMDNGCATPAGVVVIQHSNGYRTGYWHLSRVDVGAGDAVSVGASLGLAGNTGCAQDVQLHFSVQRLGRDVDPAGWCQPYPDPWAAHAVGATSRWLWLDQFDPCDLPGNAIIADDADPATTLLVGEDWRFSPAGNYGGSRWITGSLTATAAVTWRPAVPISGFYDVYAFIPNVAGDGGLASYKIIHADGVSVVPIWQRNHAGSWVSLGTYRLLAGAASRVTLRVADGTANTPLWVDAIALKRREGSAEP